MALSVHTSYSDCLVPVLTNVFRVPASAPGGAIRVEVLRQTERDVDLGLDDMPVCIGLVLLDQEVLAPRNM